MRPEAATAGGASVFLGVPVERHEALPSTNDEAFRRAEEGAPEGLVVVAGTQTSGRGRYGRSWHDVPGDSLLLSVLLRPEIPAPAWPLFALAMAASVAETGQETARAALGVKWPNDVVCRGRKLCGVLAESRGASAEGRGTLVIGAGINVHQGADDFPPELRDHATSLHLEATGAPPQSGALPDSGPSLDSDALLAGILRRFGERLALAQQGGAAALFEALRGYLPEVGTRVAIRLGGRRIEGTVESVLETGALRVRDAATGAAETIAAGELA